MIPFDECQLPATQSGHGVERSAFDQCRMWFWILVIFLKKRF